MPTNRDSRGNVPDVVSSTDRTPCAVCQQPLRRDEAATYRGEPVHPACVPTREPCLVTDGGHRHDTDRVDGTLIAECPNSTAPDDDHLQIEVNYEAAADAAAELVADIREAWPDCGECGATLQWLDASEPGEVMTGGGHAVAGLCAHDDCDGTVVWVDGTPQCKKCTRRWMS